MTINEAIAAVQDAYDNWTYGDWAADVCLEQADRAMAKAWREWAARARWLPARTRRSYWTI